MMRAKPGASLKSVLADAETVRGWLTQDQDVAGPNGSNPTEGYNQPSPTHESEAAVVGQEPKGE